MCHQLSTIRRMGIAVVLAVCVPLPAWVGAAPPSSNPGQPFAEILAQIGILNDKLDDLLANGDGVDLRGVTQNWDKKLLADDGPPCNSSRFTCIFPDVIHPDGAAVRDNETGLVWERSPSNNQPNWINANLVCKNRAVGGRKGWHLPMLEQLASLGDMNGTGVDGSGNPVKFPDGHPFQNVQSAAYWSGTTVVGNPKFAWVWNFRTDSANDTDGIKSGFPPHRVWCVRGGQSYDGQDVQEVIDALLAP